MEKTVGRDGVEGDDGEGDEAESGAGVEGEGGGDVAEDVGGVTVRNKPEGEGGAECRAQSGDLAVVSSPKWICVVDMGTAMSSTPLSQTRRNGKTFRGSSSGKWQRLPLVRRVGVDSVQKRPAMVASSSQMTAT